MKQVYTENQKLEFVRAFEKSSLTVRDYCKSVHISPFMFYHTKRSMVKKESRTKKIPDSPLFQQIVKPVVGSGISLTLPNGIKIGLEGFSLENLSRFQQGNGYAKGL